MNIEVAQDRLKTALKQVLKKQNHTYEDVAKVWSCSLPTVKRLLGKEELSLSRLLSLLDYLNLSLSDLHKLSESEQLGQPNYTVKQNEFLAKNPGCFALLMKLYEDETPASLMKKYGLTQMQMDRLLIQLEKFDLVRVGAGNRVKPFYAKSPILDGALGSAHFRQLLDTFNAYMKKKGAENLAQKEKAVGIVQWSIGHVRLDTLKKFREQYSKLSEEFEAVSKQEYLRYKKNELVMGVTFSSLQSDQEDNADFKMVSDFFGHMLQASK